MLTIKYKSWDHIFQWYTLNPIVSNNFSVCLCVQKMFTGMCTGSINNVSFYYKVQCNYNLPKRLPADFFLQCQHASLWAVRWVYQFSGECCLLSLCFLSLASTLKGWSSFPSVILKNLPQLCSKTLWLIFGCDVQHHTWFGVIHNAQKLALWGWMITGCWHCFVWPFSNTGVWLLLT